LDPQSTYPDIPRLSSRQLGAIVTRCRSEAGLSIEAMAERLDMTPAELSRVESGRRRASADLLPRIAEALDLPISALFANPQQR